MTRRPAPSARPARWPPRLHSRRLRSYAGSAR
jgi:hypothetical protein